MMAVKSRQALRVQELEEELRRLRQEMEGMVSRGTEDVVGGHVGHGLQEPRGRGVQACRAWSRGAPRTR